MIGVPAGGKRLLARCFSRDAGPTAWPSVHAREGNHTVEDARMHIHTWAGNVLALPASDADIPAGGNSPRTWPGGCGLPA